jgi:hypothetical protein
LAASSRAFPGDICAAARLNHIWAST